MDEGRVLETGTYEELMAKDGKLAEIVKSQESGSSESKESLLLQQQKRIWILLPSVPSPKESTFVLADSDDNEHMEAREKKVHRLDN